MVEGNARSLSSVFGPFDSDGFIPVFDPLSSVGLSSVLHSGFRGGGGVDLRGSGRSDFSLGEVLELSSGAGGSSEVDFGSVGSGGVHFDVVGARQSELRGSYGCP